jgi:hypothetical protein
MLKFYDLKVLIWQVIVLALGIYLIITLRQEIRLNNNIQATKVLNDCNIAAAGINDPNKFDKTNCQSILDVER